MTRYMETHYNSTEGAHDEAVETSAERIILVLSRNSNSESSSDYSYDAETSRSEEWKFDDVDCRSSSSLGASSPSCVEDSEPDMEIEISFLQEKQSLLKRALDTMKREDAYEASMARNIIDGKLEREKSPLWKEARDIVENLKQSEDTESLGNIDSRSDYMDDASDFSPLKKQKIDTSSVVCVSSGALIDGYVEKEFTGEGSSMTLAMTGSWMGQALAQTITCSLLGTPLPPLSCINGWEMVDDPSLGAIVVPPPLCCLQNGVELKDAVALTSDPQLVALSSPPFYVVHANRAFCHLSGLSGDDIVGKPLESLLHVMQDPTTNALKLTSAGALRSSLIYSKKSCQLAMMPVTNKLRNPRGGMSHLLVKVHAREVADDVLDCAILDLSLSSKSIDAHGHHQIFGTVG